MNETDALINHIDSWTQDVLDDELKMAAWVAANKLDASGLLADEERKRIIAEVQQEKLLDELLGGMETHQDGEWRICPHKNTMEIYHKGKWIETASNSIMGKSATAVWIDDPWDI